MEYATLLTLIGILILIGLSAFFSGSETALTAVSRPRMHQLQINGSRRAGLVNALRQQQERLLGTILLGNNLVNILASALATSLLITLAGETGVIYATISMTFLILIFGEILPKTYAFRNADNVALLVAPVLRFLVFVFAPLMVGLRWVTGAVETVIGVRRRATSERNITVEELRGTIALHPGSGASARQQRAMLQSVLDLADVEVGKVIKHRRDVFMIDASLSAGTIVERALDEPFTRIPLWQDTPDNIVGVLHARALLKAVHAHDGDLEDLDLRGILTPAWFIPESTTLLDQLQRFRERGEHFALVVDEYGTFLGVVTLEDILEEIVGEITDEHDDADREFILPQADGSCLVWGGVTVRDLNRHFGWDLPDQHAATIAGLVIHEAKVIPEAGQIFNFHGFRFEIVKRQRNRIIEIRMMRVANVVDADPETPIPTT